MSRYHNQGYLQQQRQRYLSELDKRKKETEEKVNRVIQSSTTEKIHLKESFPEVAEFLSAKFPDLDLSDVAIYRASGRTMNRCGFESSGGLFVPHMNVILLRSEVTIEAGTENKFERAMDAAIRAEVQPRDVLVHELMHAVSAKTRSGKKFRFGEEEFVYTNCVEFYVQHGMSDDDIVNRSILPFCINDVLADRKQMAAIFQEVRKQIPKLPDMFTLPPERYRSLMNQHAKPIVDLVVTKGREKGHEMIRLYRQYGASRLHANEAPTGGVSMRIQSIDMDDDW
jgi:hypothetical protein